MVIGVAVFDFSVAVVTDGGYLVAGVLVPQDLTIEMVFEPSEAFAGGVGLVEESNLDVVFVAVGLDLALGVEVDPVAGTVGPAEAGGGLAEGVALAEAVNPGSGFGVFSLATEDSLDRAVEGIVGELQVGPVVVGVPFAFGEGALDDDGTAEGFDAEVFLWLGVDDGGD